MKAMGRTLTNRLLQPSLPKQQRLRMWQKLAACRVAMGLVALLAYAHKRSGLQWVCLHLCCICLGLGLPSPGAPAGAALYPLPAGVLEMDIVFE